MKTILQITTIFLLLLSSLLINISTHYLGIRVLSICLACYLWYEFGKAVGTSNQVGRQKKLDELLERNK